MKTIIISLIFFSYTMVKNTDEYILIEHIGISDKPIPTLILSKKDIKLEENEFNYLLNKEEYNAVSDTVALFCKEKVDEESIEYGSFKIIHHKERRELLIRKISREDANLLFPKLINTIKNSDGNKDLVNELQFIYKRIEL